MIVMRGLRRIAKSGRAVCATIHQPSISIFSDFDSLLLLKRGGEVVFFGDLGEGSVNLITYLERYEATPRIRLGENPGKIVLRGVHCSFMNFVSNDYCCSHVDVDHHWRRKRRCWKWQGL